MPAPAVMAAAAAKVTKGIGAGGKISNAAARVGRMGRKTAIGPTIDGNPGVIGRGGRVLGQQQQAMSGYRRMGAVAGGAMLLRSGRGSSGAEGLQPHSMGGTTMGPPMY